MRGAIKTLLAIATFATIGCREMQRGECHFYAPTRLIKLDVFEDLPRLVSRHSDPNALILITGISEPRTAPRAALRIDVISGRQTIDKVPAADQSGRQPNPPGYTSFILDPGLIQDPSAHSLVRSGTLRVDFRGRNLPNPAIVVPEEMARDKSLKLGRRNNYTGTFSVMFGQRKLFEQELVNYDYIPNLKKFVAIEPDGDRLVCLCNDDRGSWLAVFHRSTLVAEQQKATR